MARLNALPSFTAPVPVSVLDYTFGMKSPNSRSLLWLSLLFAAGTALHAAPTPANAVLVLEKEQNTLVIVDPVSLTIVARVPVGNDPHEVAVSDDGKTAYISNYSSGNTISRVDLVAQKPLPPIDLGPLRQPHGLEFVGGKLFFTAEGAKVVGRYDPATGKIDWVVGTGQGSHPHGDCHRKI